MSTESRAAVARFAAAQERFATRHKVPEWAADIRRRGAERFATLGFPDSSNEAWRFTSVRPIVDRVFITDRTSDSRVSADDVQSVVAAGDAPRIVLVDGVYSASLSRLNGLPAGLSVRSLADGIANSPELVKGLLTASVGATDDAFAALGAGFLNDGAVTQVTRGTHLTEPLFIVYVSAGAPDLATFPRTLIALEREAEATIVEAYVGLGSGAYLTNALTHTTLGEGARLRHYRIQLEDAEASHIATNSWTLSRDASLESSSFAFGARLARHQLVGVLNGSNASLTLDGLSILSGVQHGDHHTTIDHAQAHCESHEVFNGVFAGEARGVFNGRIIVRPGAQRTDSKQTSNNLLLSEHARADTQPQLEIYADDVKCTHGATLGPLDETALFYLLSRGLDRAEARNALTYGFAAEILGRVSDPEVRAQLDRIVKRALRDVVGQAA